ncbi:hypothetical protein A0H81_02916 [Grifola frondosa]|uniref:Major facilitator superfamily (MFS) profile domain-containing protein n=1 Tax=Grifola frondosa TaxID=5627 RepID=A0A1C7MJ19_GRIFR|nr:hypothetical protein A0H81_02916 [Grifola frondosa]
MDDTVTYPPPHSPAISKARRWFLLFLFCVAQFLEVFNSSAIFIALPAASSALNMTAEEGAWLIASYQLTFASFLLVSGRISDVYNPKYVFLTGCASFGVLSLGSGFAKNTIGLLVIRAFTGLAASTTIPSALHLIVNMFTSQQEQAQAVAVFGAMAAIGNVLGLVLGAVLVQFATWRWVFWIGGVAGIPVAVLCLFAIPNRISDEHQQKPKNIDVIGFGIITSALLLLIFGVTSGSSLGWDTPNFIAPFVISIFLIATFGLWERTVPAERAALPSRIWAYPNFAVLAAVALTPFFWFANIFYTLSTDWQDVFHWSAISSAVHFRLPDHFSTKWIVLAGDILLIAATILLTFADSPSDYWRFAFPAFIIGSIGGTLVFSSTNITIFRVTPSEIAGTVGAIYNAALQLSTAVGIPIVTAVQVGIDAGQPGAYKGRAAAFWFVMALIVVQGLAVLVAYRNYEDVEKGRKMSDVVTEVKGEVAVNKVQLTDGNVTSDEIGLHNG